MNFYTDRENTHDMTHVSFSDNVINGIIQSINSRIANCVLAKDFPEQCPDGNGICNTDAQALYVAAKSVIPNLANFLPKYNTPITYISARPQSPFDEIDFESESEQKKEILSFAIIDFVEFVYRHIYDVKQEHYHSFYKHYELSFSESDNNKLNFEEDINDIFRRNNIRLELKNGKVRRVFNPEEEQLLVVKSPVADDTYKDLVNQALLLIGSPKTTERKIAVEKLWDSFERLKTMNEGNKKKSADKLVEQASWGNTRFKDILTTECHNLTDIGNNFQIRHFEKDKYPIDDKHVDYLFFRMLNLIRLLEKGL